MEVRRRERKARRVRYNERVRKVVPARRSFRGRWGNWEDEEEKIRG